tara:strand:- start:565 stop:843 length:279 start_codon:yes stop_codon:yes gene_type:complete
MTLEDQAKALRSGQTEDYETRQQRLAEEHIGTEAAAEWDKRTLTTCARCEQAYHRIGTILQGAHPTLCSWCARQEELHEENVDRIDVEWAAQ